MFSREFYYWCRDAVSKIHYWKDRNKVYAELYEHLEDRYETLLDKGYSEKEAEKMALDAMGSAEELAPQLAAIHKPHWAYAAIFTRFVALVMICLCIGYGADFFLENVHFLSSSQDIWDPYTQGGEELVAHVKPKDSVSCDGYTFRVDEAALWRTYYDEPTPKAEYFDTLYMRLCVTHPLPWMQENACMDFLWAEDSTGTRYDRLPYLPRRTGIFTYVYEMNFQELQEDIDWIELHYHRDGRNLVLRVDLTGGGDS